MSKYVFKIAGVLLLLASYEALARYAGWPGPAGIMLSLAFQWNEGPLAHDLEVSIARWMLGWIPGALIGVTLGLLGGGVQRLRDFLEPYRLMLRALPFIGLVPVVTRLFGTSETGKRILIAWITCSVCWPIVDQAAVSIPVHVFWKAKTLQAGWFDRMHLIRAYSQPAILSALRASLSLGWILVALVEMSGVYQQSAGNFWTEGLGYRLFRAQEDGQDGLMIATLLAFALVGAAGELVFVRCWKLAQAMNLSRKRRQILRETSLLGRSMEGAGVSSAEAASLAVKDLSATYKGSFTLSDCSFFVRKGETLPILGESGSGKTTLLRAIAHLNDDDFQAKGQILVDGDASADQQRIGIVFQDALVFPMLTVWENAIFGKHARFDPAYAYQLLVDFGIDHLAAQTAGTLSGGQRQRLALVSALANHPSILLLDEPFGALDAITRSRLQEVFVSKIRGYITCLFVTHDINEAIEVASERIMVGLGARATIVPLCDHKKPCLTRSMRSEGVRELLQLALRSVHTGPAHPVGYGGEL